MFAQGIIDVQSISKQRQKAIALFNHFPDTVLI